MSRNTLRSRRQPWLVALLAFGTTMSVHAAVAAEIVVPQSSSFPEGLTSTSDGTLYTGSVANGGIMRVLPGASDAEPWIASGAFGTRSTFGVLADERSGKLWVCSNDATPLGVGGPNAVEGSFVKRFDLKTGEGEFSARLPAAPSLCNDLAIGPDGALYVTNTLQPQILRLAEGASELEVWAEDERLKGGLDGLAFGTDGNLYVTTFLGGELFRIKAKDGKAGAVSKLALSRPLKFPDGLKADGTGFLLVEGGGPLSRVFVEGDKATVETIAEFTGPSGVTRVGDAVWVSEGQVAGLLDPAKKGQVPQFGLRSIAVPVR